MKRENRVPWLMAALGAAFCLLAIVLAGDAWALYACAKRQAIAESLKNKHKEVPLSVGVASNGTVIEVFASESGSFTIVNTRPDGLSCLIAAGENWQVLEAEKEDPEI